VSDFDPRLSSRGAAALPRFGRALKAWTTLAPGNSRAPMPWLHLVLLVKELYVMEHPRLGLWALLCFVCYLRPSEGLAVLGQDILKPSASAAHWGLQLHPAERAAPSKVGDYDDGIAIDAKFTPWLGICLGKLALQVGAEAPLFPYNYLTAKNLFKVACEKLGLTDPSPYRLRHGGASHDRAMNLRTLAEVKRRGRWVADSSLRRYDKGTLLQKTELAMHPELLRRARRVELELPKLVQGIPRGVN
jgi:hypothetical protein